jgi:fumarate hydratase subunit beta
MTDISLTSTPLPQAGTLSYPWTRDAVLALEAGDVVSLSGPVLTARDAAHKRLRDDFEAGRALPVDLAGQFVFYAGPAPARPGRVIGSVAATTSERMDAFVEFSLQRGILGMIGKGGRAPFVARLCKEHGAVYFLSTGGAAALISGLVKSAREAAYVDLGPESIKELDFEGLPLIVGIDSKGRVFQDEQIARYARGTQEACP